MSTPTPEPGRRPVLRIGDAERNAAADALQQHLASGRLTIDEYADRSAVVAKAKTQSEVDEMFFDLPPIAGAPGAAGLLASPPPSHAAPWTAAAASPAVPEPGNRRAVLIGVVSAMPFIALALFLATRQWMFFLLIPLVGAVLGPMIGAGDNDGRRGRRDRY